MADIIIAIAACLSAVAAIVSAWKASDAATNVKNLQTQVQNFDLTTLQAQVQRLEATIQSHVTNQNRAQQTQTGVYAPVYNAPVTVHVSGGSSTPEVAANAALEQIGLADATQVQWPQLPQTVPPEPEQTNSE